MIVLLLAACSQSAHIQYDFGRATWEAEALQADLSRASVADSVYPLSGNEAILLRQNVEKSSTDAESGEVEATK